LTWYGIIPIQSASIRKFWQRQRTFSSGLFSRAARNDPGKTQDAQNTDLTNDAALVLWSRFRHRPFDLGREHQEVLRKPDEKFFFGCVGRSGGNPVKLGRLLAKLHQLSLHVLHDTLYFGGCEPGELAHASI
jgi:hypothetical protein